MKLLPPGQVAAFGILKVGNEINVVKPKFTQSFLLMHWNGAVTGGKWERCWSGRARDPRCVDHLRPQGGGGPRLGSLQGSHGPASRSCRESKDLLRVSCGLTSVPYFPSAISFRVPTPVNKSGTNEIPFINKIMGVSLQSQISRPLTLPLLPSHASNFS